MIVEQDINLIKKNPKYNVTLLMNIVFPVPRALRNYNKL